VRCNFDPTGSNHDQNDPAEWCSASYERHPCEDIEPLPEPVNEFRSAAKTYLRTLQAVDEFLSASTDAKLAWITVAVVFKLTSVRGFSVDYIAEQIGCSVQALTRSIARFRAMSGLDSDGAIQQRVRPDSGASGDKPAAIRA
jgi:hypothetical protein